MQDKKKAKRRLTNIDFSKEGAHLAITSKSQGGAANSYNKALVMKSTSKFSEEFFEKSAKIRVTMEICDFLQKFFGMYYEDAEVLARLLGLEEPEEEGEDSEEEPKVNDYEDYIQSKLEQFELLKSLLEADSVTEVLSQIDEDEYLGLLRDQERIEKAFRKQESQNSKESISEEISSETVGSTEEQSVGANSAAEVITKAVSVKSGDFVSWNSSGGKAYGKVKKVVKTGTIKINENVSVSAEADNPAVLIEVYRKDSEGSWKASGVQVGHKANTLSKISALKKANLNVTNLNKTVELKESTNNMQDKDIASTEQQTEIEMTVEVVEKSQFDAVQKAFEEEKVALQKALDAQKAQLEEAQKILKALEQEKKEAIVKARFDSLKAAVKNDEKAEVLFKAASLVEDDETFQAVVKTLADMTNAAEQSELFVEKGVSVEGDGTDSKKDSAVARLLKAKHSK